MMCGELFLQNYYGGKAEGGTKTAKMFLKTFEEL